MATTTPVSIGRCKYLGTGRGRDVAGHVIEVDVTTQQLFLAERLLAVVARVRLFSRVSQDVRLEVSLVERGIGTQLTAETLFTIVRLQVDLQPDTHSVTATPR